jgi:zinc transport system ATP-binding protein
MTPRPIPLCSDGPGSSRPEPDSHTDEVLRVLNLSVRLGQTEVIRGLSFDVARGSSVAIIGPNGAGKTVLLKALIGALPSTGTYRWAAGTRIGYVPQKLDIARDVPITGLDFLRARMALAPGTGTSIADALAAVELTSAVGGQPIGALSGGQFQRLIVAFALVGSPNVLLLDEPTAGVDEPGQERLNELIHRLQQEQQLTVILVSHDLSVVYRYATSVLCLSREHVCFGAPREILTPELLQQLYGTPVAFHVHVR